MEMNTYTFYIGCSKSRCRL